MKKAKRGLKKFIPPLILFLLTLLIFRSWFVFKPVSAGDWGFRFTEQIREFTFLPQIWFSDQGNGLGGIKIFNFVDPWFRFSAKLFSDNLRLPYALSEKVIWFWSFLILTTFSSWYLAKTFFPKNRIIQFFTPFIYLFNTYILMVVGGGQMGIAMAYAIAPLVLGLFIRLLTTRLPARQGSGVNELKRLILLGVVLALQAMFDPRIALLTIGAVVLYFILGLKSQVLSLKYLASLIVPTVIAVLLHSYWLLPLILAKRVALPAGLGEAGWVEFLSFADFSNSLSLLHPNWPENIFGKTYFMRPEFLILPILAFSSLLFIGQLKSSRVKELNNSLINNKQSLLLRNKIILYFNLLALIGAFLAKGSKPPFGGIYLWLFRYFPGMSMFRDPTKFYLLVCLSYSLLIPFSLAQIIKRLKNIPNIQYLISSIFIIYWLFSIRPAWLGQLSGTFKAKEVPPEYVVLKDFIHNQEGFFRTFWVPKRQRFGFLSNNHPAVESSELLSEEELAVMGVKYVIVPYDSESEIFLEDRKYDPEQRLAFEEDLDDIPWLKKIEVADKIAVYETPDYKDHFFVADEEILPIDWIMVNPTKYKVRISEATQPFNLVFSEAYDELWQAKVGERIIPSTLYNNLNSFTIDQAGDFDLIVEFTAQKYVYWGLVVSGITMLFIIYSLLTS